MKAFFTRLSYGIQRKMFLLFSILSLVLITSLGFVASKYATQAITDTIVSNLKAKSQYTNNTLDHHIEEMRNTMFVYSFNMGLTRYLIGNFKNETERYYAYKDFSNTAQALIAPKKYCELYVLIPDTGYVYSTVKDRKASFDSGAYIDEFLRLYGQRNIIGSLIVDDFVPPSPHQEKLSFSIIQANPYVGTNSQGSHKYYIVITSSENYFKDMFKDIREDEHSDFVLITNEQYDIIYSDIPFTSEELPVVTRQLEEYGSNPQTAFTASIKDSPFIGYVHKSSSTGWRIYFFSSSHTINKETARINQAIILITALICLIMLAASYGISRSITNPLRKLNSTMKKVEKGNFDISLDIRNNDETGELAQTFNQMLAHTNSLINEVYIRRIHQKEAELYALQQQIKPHFLYNTLGAIKSLASMEKYSDIRFALQKLAEIFRYSITGDQHAGATLADELKYADSYVAIQKLRFPDKISLSFDIDKRILNIPVPKLILQPIVENSIEHTIAKQYTDSIAITISGILESSGVVYLTIRDNGPGISPDRMEEIRRTLQSSDRDNGNDILTAKSFIGLSNVNARLKWMFKEECGLQIYSDSSGTTVVLTIPNQSGEEGRGDVYVSGC
jgi:two-component system sensor histidine kinase YesM